MPQKILITGGGGFVGSYLCEAELKNNNLVIALDIANNNKVEHLMQHANFRYVQADVLNKELVEKYIKWADLVYHLAAIADPKIYCEHPDQVLKLDLEATQMVIKLVFKHNKKIIFASTSEVYGKNPKVPWKEDDNRVLGSTTFHRWSYSSSKAVGEHYCFAYGKMGLKFRILRFFNFYGPKLDFIGKGRVMPCFFEKFLKGEPVEVVEPGDQTRCFTYIDDGIQGILKVAHLPQAEGLAFNLGMPVETSIIELAELIKKVGNFDSKIIIIPVEKKYGQGYDDIFRRVPDITRAKELLNWQPRISLAEGLKKTIDYYKEEFKNSHASQTQHEKIN